MTGRPVLQLRDGVSYKAKAASTLARVLVRPVMTTVPIASWTMPFFGLLEGAAAYRQPPRWARVETVAFDGFEAEWVRAENAREDAVVLYFHGGAFMFCGLATHRPAVAALSRAGGVAAFSVAYRHLPEVALPGSLADCLEAYRWLLDQGISPDSVVFAGDSAGGYLAFATALQAGRVGLPRPAGIVAISAWLDLDCEAKLVHPNSRRDVFTPVKRLPRLTRMLAEGLDPSDPQLSPVKQDLSALPPALLIAAESEMLRCDSELMAERLAMAGVPCTLQIWEGQIHAFPVMVGLVPEAERAIWEIASFVRSRVGIDLVEESRAC